MSCFTTLPIYLCSNVMYFALVVYTGFTAVLFWVLFGGILYYTERNNPDEEMSSNYKTVPDSMWVTLLNLSGESPLAQYSLLGKIITGIIGLFATGLFGIPIGVLGAGKFIPCISSFRIVNSVLTIQHSSHIAIDSRL